MDAALGKHGTVFSGFFQGVLPLGFDGLPAVLDAGKQIHGLCLATVVASHQGSAHQRLIDASIVFGHGHQYPQLSLDGFAFTQDYIENKAIYRVVLTIEHGTTHFAGLLAKAVYPSLPLLMAGPGPCQIVMQYSG